MMVGITGATGFIGSALVEALRRAGHQTRAISLRGDLSTNALAANLLEGCEAVVNLAGEPIAQRWTEDARRKIRESRVKGTQALVSAMHKHRPQVLVNASAVGYYGDSGDAVLTESEPAAKDFLGEVCSAWEREALAAESLGVRVVRVRFGSVLGPDGGALKKMLPPFKLGVGGPIAGGKQWMSWIHRADLIAMILFLLRESTARGVFNGCSPHPVTNKEFSEALGDVLHRPAIIPVPSFAVKLLFGEMAEVVLASQRVVPEAVVRAGFTFQYPDVRGALAEILR